MAPPCPGADLARWTALQQVHDAPGEPYLDFAECFAGHGAVHRALAGLGYTGRALDREYCAGHDVLKPVGFLCLMSTCLELKPGGVLWAAPPCSTWVWLSRHSTGRDVQVEGDTTREAVVSQNALVERLVLRLEILTLRGVYWIIEQPATSVMYQYPALRDCLRRHGCTEPCVLDMGAYGGTSQKPTHLVGTAPYLGKLARRCDPQLKLRLAVEGVQTTTRWLDADGRLRCQGTAALKGTQAYPEGFGAAHALCFQEHYGRACGDAPVVTSASSSSAPEAASLRASLQGPAELAMLLDQLPKAVQEALSSGWWLRDFLGEPWQ